MRGSEGDVAAASVEAIDSGEESGEIFFLEKGDGMD
jgi:hypothetical protein